MSRKKDKKPNKEGAQSTPHSKSRDKRVTGGVVTTKELFQSQRIFQE